MHRFAARERGHGRPQRVVRGRHQQLIAVVKQGVDRHRDEVAGPIAQIDVVERDPHHPLLLGVVHDGLAGGKNAFAVGVTGRIGQVADHVLLDFFGCLKAKRRQVADVELDDFLALVLHLLGGVHDRTAHIVEHIGQLGRFFDGFQRTLQTWVIVGKPII